MKKVLVLYHYFYPDDVVSAVVMSDLCAGLAQRGWNVTAKPGRRAFTNDSQVHPRVELWSGVRIKRVWRPPFRQTSAVGRILNAAWMISAWSFAALGPGEPPDVLIIGTDPILSILVARFWRLVKPKTKIVHWCFDLYPEAAIADDVLRRGSLPVKILQRLLKGAYASCDLIIDIGSCMRALLDVYRSPARKVTLVPWALEEPAALSSSPPRERASLFGNARLALMYSGSFGRAHSHEDILELAREMRGDGLHLVFSVRGNRERALRNAVSAGDINVSFAPFAPPHQLRERLAAADIHVVSLREEWTGTVVPSKFFGALAIGRPVIFCGSPTSAIAEWIRRYDIGWVLAPGHAKEVGAALRVLLANGAQLDSMKERCFRVYHEQFAKHTILDHWDRELRALVPDSE